MNIGETVTIEKSVLKIRPLLTYFMKQTNTRFTAKKVTDTSCTVTRQA